MKVKESLSQVEQIVIPPSGYPVEETIAREIGERLGISARVGKMDAEAFQSKKGVLYVAVVSEGRQGLLSRLGLDLPSGEWVVFHLDRDSCLWLLGSKPCFLFSGSTFLIENLTKGDISPEKPWVKKMSFSIEKSTFDLFLTQYARLIRDFGREKYIREHARLGFTHLEVNALASAYPYEKGVPGEFYPDFYTYCPALDQFTASRLNRGLYPEEYLKANLERLKENARLALKYGLTPGLLCFEPRSVPEELFKKYPTLRGARVDHPFRSLKPRFNLSVAHPVVRRHYAELLTNLMHEVPELEFLTIWSNDSGAGFEHTKSLYVGRNGGAYLVREWKDDEDIAEAAASNIASFFNLLRDTGSRINPRFRVISRLESFCGERTYLWPGIKNRIDVEANSLLTSAWEANYPHPRYSEVKVLGSAYHNTLKKEESALSKELESRNSRSYFYHFLGSHTNHEPLLGIPFPWLTYEKLSSCSRLNIETLAHIGGIHPPDKVPYAANQEVFRRYQADSSMDIGTTVSDIAVEYAGESYAPDLVQGWKLIEQAIRGFMPLSIYSHYGVVWQRLFVRPLVPDIGRIPEPQRAYYEKYMCTSVHNPNRVDLSKDVLFELIDKEYAGLAVDRIDKNVWAPLNSVIDLFKRKMEEASRDGEEPAKRVFEDQYFRARALRCLYTTLRNTAVWIYAVHEYLDSDDQEKRAGCLKRLDDMIRGEIKNCHELIELWETAPLEWMIVSGSEETAFIYGPNFPVLINKKISLMERHRSDEPFIDPGYMFRIVNDPYH
jgi:hypothetical protein